VITLLPKARQSFLSAHPRDALKRRPTPLVGVRRTARRMQDEYPDRRGENGPIETLGKRTHARRGSIRSGDKNEFPRNLSRKVIRALP
jgi:hypothetical protein